MDTEKMLSDALDKVVNRALQDEDRHKLFTLNRLVIFFLVGGNDKDVHWILSRLKLLLCNPDACVVLVADKCGPDTDWEKYSSELANRMEAEINRISETPPAGIGDLTSVMVCPVVFGGSKEGNFFPQIADSIIRFISLRGMLHEWQPFLLLKLNRTAEYAGCRRAVEAMEAALDGVLNPQRSCRCCLLCNMDSHAMLLRDEWLLDTLVFLTLLRNSSANGEEGGISQSIGNIAGRRDDCRHYFTARAASLENPVLPVMLERVWVIMNTLLEGTSFLRPEQRMDEEIHSVLQKMDFSFLDRILEPYLNQLPHNEDGITTLPLYGIMRGDGFNERVKEYYYHYYVNPLKGKSAVREQRGLLNDNFLMAYINMGGSFKGAKKLVNMREVVAWLDRADTGGTAGSRISPNVWENMLKGTDYEKVSYYEEHLRIMVRDAKHKLLDLLSGGEMRDQLVGRLDDTIKVIADISEHLKRHSQSLQQLRITLNAEISVLGGSTIEEQQKTWLWELLDTGGEDFNRKWLELKRKSVELVRSGGQPELAIELVELCCRLAEEGILSNMQYMDMLSQNCIKNPNLPAEYEARMRTAWYFPARLRPELKNNIEDDSMFGIVGWRDNAMLRGLADKCPHSQQLNVQFNERIDILRLSSEFSHTELALWDMIESAMDDENTSFTAGYGEKRRAKPVQDIWPVQDICDSETPCKYEDPECPYIPLPQLGASFVRENGCNGIRLYWKGSVRRTHPWLFAAELIRCDTGFRPGDIRRTYLPGVSESFFFPLEASFFDVTSKRLIVFASPDNITPKIDLAKFKDRGFFVDTAAGYCSLRYSVAYKKGRHAQWATLRIEASSGVKPGLLCYGYNCSGLTYRYKFPSGIANGTKDYAPVLIPLDAELYVKTVRDEFNRNITISCTDRKSFSSRLSSLFNL